MLQQSDVCVLIPTCRRPTGLTRSLQTLHDTAPDAFAVVAAEQDDQVAEWLSQDYETGFIRCPTLNAGAAAAWNTALRGAEAIRKFKAYFTGSDDIIFHKGWLDEVLRVLDVELHDFGLVGINDVKKGRRSPEYFKSPNSFVTHYLMVRDWMVKYHGGVAAIPHYFCNWTDCEATQRAILSGYFAMANDAIVEHDWRGGKDGTGDQCYQRAYEQRQQAAAVWEDRLERGFPDDFPPIITG